MHFRRERRNGGGRFPAGNTGAGKEDSALTLSDVLQDGFCMEDACERQDEARRLRRLIEGLPARERKLILLRYGLAGQPPLTPTGNGTAAPDQQKLCLKARDPRTGTAAQRLASRITGRIKGAACGRRTYPLLAALQSNALVTRIFSPRSFLVLRRQELAQKAQEFILCAGNINDCRFFFSTIPAMYRPMRAGSMPFCSSCSI